MTPAALTPGALDAARELERVKERIATIADEATGPHPVQSVDESLTCIERGFVSYRRTSEIWRAERDAALADLAKAREELEFARDSYAADRCEADGIRAERDELRAQFAALGHAAYPSAPSPLAATLAEAVRLLSLHVHPGMRTLGELEQIRMEARAFLSAIDAGRARAKEAK